MDKKTLQAYWKKNIQYVAILLSIWFVVSYGCGILFAEELNHIRIGGFKLGFWFAQQGSIYIFVILIFVYVSLMNKLDKKFGVYEDDEKADKLELNEKLAYQTKEESTKKPL